MAEMTAKDRLSEIRARHADDEADPRYPIGHYGKLAHADRAYLLARVEELEGRVRKNHDEGWAWQQVAAEKDARIAGLEEERDTVSYNALKAQDRIEELKAGNSARFLEWDAANKRISELEKERERLRSAAGILAKEARSYMPENTGDLYQCWVDMEAALDACKEGEE